MKNIIKTGAYSLVALSSIAYSNVSALDFEGAAGKGEVTSALKGNSGNDFSTTIQTLIAYLLGFLALIAVIFAMWGGFQILTAGGDDDKVKKGKTTLINALLGLFVIWISWTLVSWFVNGLTTVTG